MNDKDYEVEITRLSRLFDVQVADNLNLRRALDSIAHYVAENPELAFDYPVLKRALEDAGYDVGAPGEPEPFIHGDNAEGAEG